MLMTTKTKREATLFEALIPVIITIGLLMYAVLPQFGVGTDVHIPLVLGAMVAAIVAVYRLGYTWQEIEEGMVSTR